MTVKYVQLSPGSAPPPLESHAFLAIFVIAEKVDDEWREKICRWVVDEGCLFMMAWGVDCVLWHDAVDQANIEDFPDSDIPWDRFVMTTWHPRETLQKAFRFAHVAASHPEVDFLRPILIDICSEDRSMYLRALFRRAKQMANRLQCSPGAG